jgi:hypothetical protein
MRRLIAAGAVTALALVASVSVALADGGTSMAEPGVERSTVDQNDSTTRPRRYGRAGERAGEGHGPPPWASGFQGGPPESWHETWRDMTPQQRELRMSELAVEHAAGMRRWSACVAHERRDCEKPHPPGLARKRVDR